MCWWWMDGGWLILDSWGSILGGHAWLGDDACHRVSARSVIFFAFMNDNLSLADSWPIPVSLES